VMQQFYINPQEWGERREKEREEGKRKENI
jgi:hypothetical protein